MSKFKFIYVFSLLFLLTNAVSAQQNFEIEEYVVAFSSPKGSPFTAKEESNINIASEYTFSNEQKMKWELFFNADENKLNEIKFTCPKSVAFEDFYTHVEAITDKNFWEATYQCLPKSISQTIICVNMSAAFERLDCLLYKGKNCGKK